MGAKDAQTYTTAALLSRQPLAAKLIAERLRVLSLGEAEHDEAEIIAAQGVRELRRR
jgi:hypothetical protein